MTTITYVICDGCGTRVADYEPVNAEWVEGEGVDEDYCPKCAPLAEGDDDGR